jgi:UDP-N-acetylmuramoyl-L-alanyl-D-glutamate--2,6-diaminopimelate ligase
MVQEFGTVSTDNRMLLMKLLEGVPVSKIFQTLYGQMVVTHDVQVRTIQYDSRSVHEGDLFIALRGSSTDGHRFVSQAISNGAKVVVMEDDAALPDSYFMHTGVVKVVVSNTRAALAQMAARFYGHPADQLTMIGVTGTNGKSTTTHIVKEILESNGIRSGLIGTIYHLIGFDRVPATHTTPESLELQELLARMVGSGCNAAVMEVSSHALHQHRTDTISFDAAVFTNLTQDHLDYHGSMDEYFNAKKRLFDGLDSDAHAIVNIDDPWGERIVSSCRATVCTYGVDNMLANVRATNVKLSVNGTSFAILEDATEVEITSPLIGLFNVYNVLAAWATGRALGIDREMLHRAVEHVAGVPGRFQRVSSPFGWTAVVDYAHTPDALENVLNTLRTLVDRSAGARIITVFGCGGDRDRSKRPLMGRIASELSDRVIVTSDNPRTEDPDAIIDEVMAGVASATVACETDRRRAIEQALTMAQPGDVVLIAGKGHEDYQIIGTQRVPFDDRRVVEEFIKTR